MGKKRHHSRKPEALERRRQIRVLHQALDEKLDPLHAVLDKAESEEDPLHKALDRFERKEFSDEASTKRSIFRDRERTLNQNGGHTGESDGDNPAIDSRSTNAIPSSSSSTLASSTAERCSATRPDCADGSCSVREADDLDGRHDLGGRCHAGAPFGRGERKVELGDGGDAAGECGEDLK